MRRVLAVGLLTLLVIIQSKGSTVETSLLQLDEALAQKESYVNARLARIDALRKRLEANRGASVETRFELCNSLYQHYKSFVFDSAFHYCNRLIDISYELNDPGRIGYAKTHLGFTLLSAGMFKEAFDTLNAVVVKDLMDSAKVEYYALMSRILYDLADFNGDSYYSPKYVQNANRYIDFATSLAEPNSYHHLYLNGLRNLRVERTDEAIQYLNKLLDQKPAITGQKFAIAASTLSYLHLKLGDTTKAVQLLVDACISDTEEAIKETSAMTSLARLLYSQGNMEPAYRYITESMSDARYYGALQRMSQVGNILPIISGAKLNNVEGQRKKLLIYSIGLTILALLTVAFAVLMVIQKGRISKRDTIIKQNNDKLRGANAQLSEINKIKDEYLGFYFDLNAKYLDKMAKIKKTIDSKLIEQRYDDIRYILRKFDLKKEREDLFRHFDESFVKIFPNYIPQFNELFDPENQYLPAKNEILCTELRLFALVRIGISDSDRLASILGYSVNTIYAYKNRIKSQSNVPNNEFDQRIMAIQSN